MNYPKDKITLECPICREYHNIARQKFMPKSAVIVFQKCSECCEVINNPPRYFDIYKNEVELPRNISTTNKSHVEHSEEQDLEQQK